ncbi:hypothetical protein JQ604_31580 [Bradyrhizobium jicamae]|uniref:hypothetical protein n=1 Tax=Bradyrhizobium jicamae TaxID=280332 RepID=UPI001BA841C7|nr:hypothetical protein [Bradyrhizobium jicamae]
MSEQQSEPVSEAVSDTAARAEPVMAAAAVEAPRLAPEQEETSPKADAPRIEMPKAEMPKVEAFTVKAEAPKVEPPRIEIPKVEVAKVEPKDEPRFPGKLMIMAPGERTWDHEATAAKPAAEETKKPSGARRFAAMAAMVALATVAGAIGGALATASFGQPNGGAAVAATKDAAATRADAVEASIARIDSELLALKASVEHSTKMGMSQFNKTSDRLDKVEKAQAEPLARIAKLSESVDKLRATPPAVPAPVAAAAPAAARDVTGTVTQPATTTAAAAPAPAKPEVGRLPTVEGWVLRDVANGGALIEGRQGIFEVYAGDPVPGLGRVDAIRKQDGRWVVVTSKGLVIAR